jgi:sodium transport system permease protein
MNIGRMWTLAWRDMWHALRDKRNMLTIFLISVVIYPALIVGVSWFQSNQQTEALEKVYILQVNDRVLFNRLLETVQAPFKFELLGAESTESGDGKLLIQQDDAGFTVTWEQRSDRMRNVFLNQRLISWIKLCNEQLRLQKLKELGVDANILQPVTFNVVDVTPEEQRQNPLVGILGYFMALGIIVGGMGVAIDTTAAEKERKTLLTLYASPHTPTEIMTAKLIHISFFAVLAAILNVLSMGISLTVLLPLIEKEMDAGLRLDVTVFIHLLSLVIVLAVLLSAMMLAIGIYARTIKEATYWMTPLLFVVIFIGLTWSSVDAEPFSWVYWTPIVNVFVSIRDSFSHQLTGAHWLITIGTMTIAILIVSMLTKKLFQSESVLFRN